MVRLGIYPLWGLDSRGTIVPGKGYPCLVNCIYKGGDANARKPEPATPAEAITEPSWLRDIKPPKTENVAGHVWSSPNRRAIANTY